MFQQIILLLFSGGIYSSKVPNQNCEAAKNVQSIVIEEEEKSKCKVKDENALAPLGWTVIEQLAIPYSVGLGLSLLALVSEAVHFKFKNAANEK